MFLGIIFLYQEQNVDVILIHNQEHFTWLNYCKSLQCASTSHWPICREKQELMLYTLKHEEIYTNFTSEVIQQCTHSLVFQEMFIIGNILGQWS